MIRQLLLRELIENELNRCENLYIKFKKMLVRLPYGSLLDRNGHAYRAYRKNGKQFQTPIKDNTSVIQSLKYRQFIKKALPKLEKRIKACSLFLKCETMYDPEIIEAEMKEVYHGLEGCEVFLEGDMSLNEWRQESYRRNPKAFEEEHYTDGGQRVRSKAEAMIGTQAEHRKMAFRCEPAKDIGIMMVYPDFEFFLPITRRHVYLEHFGKMDDPAYVKRTMIKLMEYHKAGLYLGINFFFTWETRDKPLNIKDINNVLDLIQQLDDKCM